MKPIHLFVIGVIAAGATVRAAGDLRLVDAVRSRNADAVQSLLKQRVDVNAVQGDGATALHWAAHHDDLRIADLLIGAGARVNAANDTGVTPLFLACTNRNAAMVERLLAAKANPNAALLNGETVLMTCSRTGEPAAVQALLARRAAVNVKEPARGQTALMWAAAQRHPEVVRALVEHGADVDARSRVYQQTVTSEVTQRAAREELNYTVARGGSTPLLFAARVGDAESARILLEAGADVNDSFPDGISALTAAAHSGQQAVGILLLEKGADPNAAAGGYTALHAAVLRNGLDLVKALLAHGANPNASITRGTPVRRNSEDFELPATLVGATPYLLAARFLEVDIMRVLAAGGADPRRPMKTGATPLMAAAGLGASAQTDRRGLSALDGGKVEDEGRVLDATRAALELGGDVNAMSDMGDTALHAAAALGYNTVVQFLADHGAQLNAKNKRGQTALAAIAGRQGDGATATDRASQAPRQSTVDLLRSLGAND
ncbi:MAG: ankyrin repeat domain-containing protein [Acidobacteriota bacterium]